MTLSQIERPSEKWIRAFKPSMVGSDRIRDLLKDRFSLVICCKHCPRLIEWTPPELARRFGEKVDLKLADLVPRLACTGDEGCGSHEIAVFPNFWPGDWRWTPPAQGA